MTDGAGRRWWRTFLRGLGRSCNLATFRRIETIETVNLDLSDHNDLFTLDNSLADVNVMLHGRDGDDRVTVRRIGGPTKFEGDAGADTLTIDFGSQPPRPMTDLAFHVETVVVDSSSHGGRVDWQAKNKQGILAAADADILLIHDDRHVTDELRIIEGQDSGSTLSTKEIDGRVIIDGNRLELNRTPPVLSPAHFLNSDFTHTPGTRLGFSDVAAIGDFVYAVSADDDTLAALVRARRWRTAVRPGGR